MKNKIIIENKRSQIGTTLTWFTAFIIIFFIMVLFLSAAIYSSGRKRVSAGWDEITLKEYSGNLEMQRSLFDILNSNIEFDGKSGRVKDILRGIDMYTFGSNKKNELIQKIKKQTEDILRGSLVGDCYVFSAVYGIEPEKINEARSSYAASLIEKSSLEFSSFSQASSSYSGYSEKQKQKLLESASEITLLRESTMNVFGYDEKENQRIKIKFYGGKCL